MLICSSHNANISFLYNKDRETEIERKRKRGHNPTAHLDCDFDLIPIFICFTRELHLSQYHWAACRFSHFVSCTLKQMRAEEVHVFFHICTGKKKKIKAVAKKLLRQKERQKERKRVCLVPGLLTTTCIFPTCGF